MFYSRYIPHLTLENTVGVSENTTLRCLLWHQEQQPICLWQSQQEDIAEAISQLPSNRPLSFIRAIPHTYIWRKVVQFPIMESYLLYKNIIDSFKQALPIKLSEVYFDYKIEKNIEKNRMSVSLFALRRTYADTLNIPNNTIMDCQLHCYLRAFKALLPEIHQPITQNYYVLNDFSFQYQQEELQINPTSPHNKKYHINELCLPTHILDKELYLSALGASLWSGEE